MPIAIINGPQNIKQNESLSTKTIKTTKINLTSKPKNQ